MSIGVYTIVNLVNQRIYVGSSINVPRRFIRHTNALNKGKHENGHLQAAWNKYGAQVFKFKQIYNVGTVEIARSVEQKLIDLWMDRGLYNISLNACGASVGENNPAKRIEVRQKISAALKGKYLSAEAKINIGIASRKVWASPQHRERMSEIRKECWVNPIYRENILLARKQAMQDMSIEERKELWGAPNRGIKRDHDTYSLAGVKRWADPKQRAVLCAAMKGPREKVLCPHCGKVGGKGNMHRYHFDKCKQRK